jgi:hypothetical protein
VSPPKQRAVVLRTYQPTTDATARAVEMLLRCDQGTKKGTKPALEPSAVGRMKHEEEVSHVEQRTR